MSPLVVDNISKAFRQGERPVSALGGVNLEVRAGQFLAIMGASGSGKSTLLHLMAGLTRPDRGRILANGQNLAELNDHQLTMFRRRQIEKITEKIERLVRIQIAVEIRFFWEIADARFCRDVTWRVPKNLDMAFRREKQAEQHLHRR